MYAIFVADNTARGGNRNFMRLLNGDGITVPSGSNSTANGAFKGGNGIALGRFARFKRIMSLRSSTMRELHLLHLIAINSNAHCKTTIISSFTRGGLRALLRDIVQNKIN